MWLTLHVIGCHLTNVITTPNIFAPKSDYRFLMLPWSATWQTWLWHKNFAHKGGTKKCSQACGYLLPPRLVWLMGYKCFGKILDIFGSEQYLLMIVFRHKIKWWRLSMVLYIFCSRWNLRKLKIFSTFLVKSQIQKSSVEVHQDHASHYQFKHSRFTRQCFNFSKIIYIFL